MKIPKEEKMSLESERNWRDLDEKYTNFVVARNAYFELRESIKKNLDVVESLKSDASGLQRGLALEKALDLSDDEKKSLFSELIALASFGHGHTDLCKKLIYSMPRDWVLQNIEKIVESVLVSGGYEEYSAVIGLYSELSADLAKGIALRASQNLDPDIKEIGDDYLHDQ